MSRDLKKHLIKTASIAMLATTVLATTAVAATGTTYNSKGVLTVDGTNIYIDAADVTNLDSAIDDNTTSLNNFDSTAGDIYNNLDAIDTGINKAKSALAHSLASKLFVNIEESGTVYSSDEPKDWSSDTVGASSTAANSFTLKKLVDAVTDGGVTDADSQRTATIKFYADGNNDSLANKTFSSVTGIDAIAFSVAADGTVAAPEGTGSIKAAMAGKTVVDLGVSESITLPSGYYATDTTINNGVKNRGNASLTDITAGSTGTLPAGYYDGITFSAKSLASQTVSDAAAADILSGKTAYVNGEKVTGSMPNNGNISKTLDTTTTSYTIDKGYHSGAGVISVSPEDREVTAGTSTTSITANTGKVIKKVTVNPTPSQTKSATPSDKAQTITPDSGKLLSSVTVAAVTSSSGVGKTMYDSGYSAGVTATKKGNATAAQVLSGKTFTSASAGVNATGTMSDKSGAVASGTVSYYALSGKNYLKMPISSAGYYDTSDYLYNTSVLYNPTGTGGTAATSGTAVKTTSTGVSLAGSNLVLDSGAKVTIPAGYYSSAINVSSGGSTSSMNKIHVGVITDSHGVTWTAPYDCYLITVGQYPILHYEDGIASWDTDFKINGKQITTNMFTGVDGGHGLYFFPNIKKGDVIYINTKLQQWNIVASTIELS